MDMQQKINQVVAVLQQAVQDFSPVCFANSLGAEDMVLTDIIAKNKLAIEMFSLDTGRLPQETYDLMQEVSERYDMPLKMYFPDSTAVENYVAQNGVNGFYDSVDARKGCCFVRKVEPLRRALHGKKAWVTGMRRDQAVTRGMLEVSAYDADQCLQKLNPLLDWTNKEVWAYIRQHDVPYNKLHDQFYPSLGCAPCTRSISPGEDIRAGRWWWENPENKECGLHVKHASQVAHGFGVAAQGDVRSKAHDVSLSQNLTHKECGLHVSSTSLEASRNKIQEMSEQVHVTEKTVA
jgi:phosphoadenosine phosphosulfate reductase